MPECVHSVAARARTLVATLMLAAGMAHAQVAELPATLPASASIAASDRSRIDSFVESHAAGLTEGDTARVRTARDALLRPLTGPTVTIAFRQAYGSALEPLIGRLIESPDATRRLAGLRLAGEAGTEGATQALLRAAGSDDDGLRLFAFARLERVLQSASSPAPGLTPETTRAVIDRLAEAVAAEADPRAADAAARALAEAVRSNTPSFSALRFAAVDELASRLGDRLRGASAEAPRAREEMLLALRGIGVTREAVADVNSRPSSEAAAAAARLGGDAVAYAFARVQTGLAPAEDRELETQLVAAGEGAVYFGRLRHAEARGELAGVEPTGLEALLKAGNDREFRNSFIQLFGPSSAIVESLGLDRDRFMRPGVGG